MNSWRLPDVQVVNADSYQIGCLFVLCRTIRIYALIILTVLAVLIIFVTLTTLVFGLAFVTDAKIVCDHSCFCFRYGFQVLLF